MEEKQAHSFNVPTNCRYTAWCCLIEWLGSRGRPLLDLSWMLLSGTAVAPGRFPLDYLGMCIWSRRWNGQYGA